MNIATAANVGVILQHKWQQQQGMGRFLSNLGTHKQVFQQQAKWSIPTWMREWYCSATNSSKQGQLVRCVSFSLCELDALLELFSCSVLMLKSGVVILGIHIIWSAVWFTYEKRKKRMWMHLTCQLALSYHPNILAIFLLLCTGPAQHRRGSQPSCCAAPSPFHCECLQRQETPKICKQKKKIRIHWW